MKALLIEDNKGDVQLIECALKTVDDHVELFVADDGVKALDFLQGDGRAAPARRPTSSCWT